VVRAAPAGDVVTGLLAARHDVTQLDLFGAVESAQRQRDLAERQRLVGALTCLRDSVPEALESVATLAYQRDTDTRAPHASGRWAYCVCRAGLRYEDRDEWGTGARLRGERYGWDRTPARLVTWAELTALVGQEPRRAEIRAWVDSLPEPRWRPLMRPHELWPDPGGWHVSYLCHDHVDAGWTGRLHAWRLVLDLLGDAIDAVPVPADVAGVA
jgi:hypothetical protein